MLPNLRRAAKLGLIPFHSVRCRRHFDRLPVHRHRARAQLRVNDQSLHQIDGPVGGLRVGQSINRLRMAQTTEDGLDDGFEFLTVSRACGVIAKARVLGQ